MRRRGTLYDLFCKPNYIDVVLDIDFINEKLNRGATIRDCVRAAGMSRASYAYVSEVLRELEKEGYVKIVRGTLPYRIYLTEKGKRLAEHLLVIKKMLLEVG